MIHHAMGIKKMANVKHVTIYVMDVMDQEQREKEEVLHLTVINVLQGILKLVKSV